MNNSVVILSLYPAPYRLGIYKYICDKLDAKVFFETASGDNRDKRWFKKGSYHLINTVEGRKEFFEVCKNIKNYKLVVLYEYTTKNSRKLIKLCNKYNVPYVVNCDGIIAINKKNFIKDFIKRKLLNRATAYMASGRLAKEYFLRYGAKEEKVYTHHFSSLYESDLLLSPLTNDEKLKIREKLDLRKDIKIAIAVGRFIPLKNYDKLIEEWRLIDDKCCLLLIGGGPEEDRYREIIKKYNIKNVLIKGFYPPDQLYEYYKAADLFVHTSTYEAWGLVVNEAMANALPVVVSNNCTVAKEIIRDGENGLLFDTYNERQCVEKIDKLLSDGNLQKKLSINALETIKPYTIENMAKTHMEIFNKIINNGK